MAVLNSIRKRGFFLILIIAMALFAFVLSDIITKGTSGGDIQNIVATVNGEEIPREEFMTRVENYQRSLGPNSSQSTAMNQVWDQELRSILFNQQANDLGISVGEDEMNDQMRLAL